MPNSVRLTRILPASPEAVFDMWLDAERMKTWMCPGNTHVSFIHINPIVGGAFQIDMQSPNADVAVHRGQYLEIERPRKLRFTWETSLMAYRTTIVTVECYPHDDGCQLVLTHEQLADNEIEHHAYGWTAIVDLLESQVVNARQ